MLIRLLYVSTAKGDMDIRQLRQIMSTAHQNNMRNDVTGMLVYSNKLFLQVLEGRRPVVNRLYEQIVRDARHHLPMLLKYEYPQRREFSSWMMGCEPNDVDSRTVFLKYSPSSVFNPYEMNPDSAELLMTELSSTAIPMSYE